MRTRFDFCAIAAIGLVFGCGAAEDRPNAEVSQVEIAPLQSAASRPPPSEPKPDGVRLPFSPESGSAVSFVGRKTTGSHDGKFERFNGSIDFVAENIERSRVRVDIDMASVSTDADKLTAHLLTSDFFFVENFAVATFQSTKLELAPEGKATHRMEGMLELRGRKLPMSFPVQIDVTGESVTAQAELTIKRTDFGINYPGKPDDPISDMVQIRLNVVALRPQR